MRKIARIWNRIIRRWLQRNRLGELYGDSFPVLGGKFSW